MLDDWFTVLGGLGVKKPKASAMLQQVEVAIARTLTGVWKVFAEEAHGANAGPTKGEARHQEMQDVMATLAEASRPMERDKELRLFDNPSATQRKRLRSKRMRKLKARRRTLDGCGIGIGARGAGSEAPGRCLKNDAIDPFIRPHE